MITKHSSYTLTDATKRVISSKLTLALLAALASAYILFPTGGVFVAAIAQPLRGPSGDMNMSMSGNQTMDSAASDLVPYNNWFFFRVSI